MARERLGSLGNVNNRARLRISDGRHQQHDDIKLSAWFFARRRRFFRVNDRDD
jgi:hypothetical protein